MVKLRRAFLGFWLIAIAAGAAPLDRTLQVRSRGIPERGSQEVLLRLYVSADAETPVQTERRSVVVDARGEFKLDSRSFSSFAVGADPWISVQIGSRPEGKRARLRMASGALPAALAVSPDAAIWSGGLIESAMGGYRFPDGTVQTSAAQVSGGVPSVNAIGGAVTIVGSGTVAATTVGSTITLNGAGVSGVMAGTGLTGGGTSGNVALAVSFGSPSPVAVVAADGSAGSAARSDHVHAHAVLDGGNLHSAATTSAAGFLSSTDKEKLDRLSPYVRTLIVSPVPGDALASGTALRAAFGRITDNSSTNPYLVKLEPGIYDLGTTPLLLKDFVDLEGSGEAVTVISGSSYAVAAAPSSTAAVISATGVTCGLRLLTIKNAYTSATGYADSVRSSLFVSGSQMRVTNTTITMAAPYHGETVAIRFTDGGTLEIDHAKIVVGGRAVRPVVSENVQNILRMRDTKIEASPTSFGFVRAVHLTGGTADLEDVVIALSGDNTAAPNYGVMLDGASAYLNGVRIVVYGAYCRGLWVSGGSATVMNSVIRTGGTSSDPVAIYATASAVVNVAGSRLESQQGIGYSFYRFDSASTVTVAHTMASAGAGTGAVCIGNYTSAGAALICPP